MATVNYKYIRKAITTLALIAIQLLISFVFFVLIAKYAVTDDEKLKIDLFDMSNIYLVIILVIVKTTLEELMFRLPIKMTQTKFIISLSIILLWAIFKLDVLWGIPITILSILLLKYYKSWHNKINLLGLVIIYNCLFAIAHLSNYSKDFFLIENAMGGFLILSQKFISGIVLTYAYLKLSIIHSIVIHAITNIVFILLYNYL